MSRHVDCKPPPFYQSIYQAYEAGIQPSPDEAQAFEQAAVHKRQLLQSRGAAAPSPARYCQFFVEDYYTPDECLDVSSGLKLRPPVPRTRPQPPRQLPTGQPTQQPTPTAPSSKCAPPTDPYPSTIVTLRVINGARRRNKPDGPPFDANGTSGAPPHSPHLPSPTAITLPEACDGGTTPKCGELSSASASAAAATPVAASLCPAPTAPPAATAIAHAVDRKWADVAAAGAPIVVDPAATVAAPPATIARRENGAIARPPFSQTPPLLSPPPPYPPLLIDETIDRITMRELPGDGSDLFGLSFTQRRQFCWRFYLLPAPPEGSWQCFAEMALRAVSNAELTLVDSFATRYGCPAPEVILYHWQHLWQTERSSLCLLPPSHHSVRRILDALGRADLMELLPPPTAQ